MNEQLPLVVTSRQQSAIDQAITSEKRVRVGINLDLTQRYYLVWTIKRACHHIRSERAWGPVSSGVRARLLELLSRTECETCERAKGQRRVARIRLDCSK